MTYITKVGSTNFWKRCIEVTISFKFKHAPTLNLITYEHRLFEDIHLHE